MTTSNESLIHKPYFDSLPDELFIEILHRFSLHFIHQLKCVSKRWLVLTSSEDFVRRYTLYNISFTHLKPRYAFFYQCCNRMEKRFHFAYSEIPSLKAAEPILDFLPFVPSTFSRYNVICSSNGLLLCTAPRTHTSSPHEEYCVCNPLTKQWVVVPSVSRSGLSPCIGFVCKSKGGGCSFRIVRIPFPLMDNFSIKFETYNSELRRWEETIFNATHLFRRLPLLDSRHGLAVASNGLLHWANNEGSIFVYDPYNDKAEYKIISLPNKFNSGTNTIIGVCKERLMCLEKGAKEYVVWELEDYDTGKWSLKHEFDDPHSSLKHATMLGFHPLNEDIVFLQLLDQIVRFNIREKILDTVCKIDWKKQISIVPVAFPWWPPCISKFSYLMQL